MGEVWKEIKGSKGYMVSSMGNVRSKYKDLTLCKNKHGYNLVNVTYIKVGVPRTQKVHRLVALAFLDNPFGKRTVNHKNGIRDDNRVENLEWNTHSENIKHSYDELGRRSVTNEGDKNGFSKRVICLLTGKTYGSLMELCRKENINIKYSTLRAMLSGQNKNKTNYRYVCSA